VARNDKRGLGEGKRDFVEAVIPYEGIKFQSRWVGGLDSREEKLALVKTPKSKAPGYKVPFLKFWPPH
jgi:hypothetical protein